MEAGSSINVLFWAALKQMRMKVEYLQHIATPLFGFSEHMMHLLNQVKLPLSLGEEPRHQTILTTPTMVEAPSVYIRFHSTLFLSLIRKGPMMYSGSSTFRCHLFDSSRTSSFFSFNLRRFRLRAFVNHKCLLNCVI